MNSKDGCSAIVFLMLLVVGIFLFEFLKLNQNTQSLKSGCANCEKGGPTKEEQTEPVQDVVQQLEEITGHDSTGGSWAAPF